MRTWLWVVPLVGACAMAGVPLAQYGEKMRAEAAALDALREVQAAQERIRAAAGGYATDLASLTSACGSQPAPMTGDTVDALLESGYVVTLRAAGESRVTGADCAGRPLATNYYVAAAPRSAWEAAGTAFAGIADGQLYAFVDGVPPREVDIATGLPTSADALDTFKIP